MAAWIYFVTFADAPFMLVVYSVCKVVQFSFPLAWVFLIRSKHQEPAAPATRNLAAGALSGLAVVSVMWAVYLTVIDGGDLALEASPRIASRIVAIGATSPAKFLALTLFFSVIHSLLEEYYWRWFVFGRLRIYWSGALAVIVSSIAFAGHHLIVLYAFIGPGQYWWMTVPLSLAVAFGGGLWAWLYERSGSLFSPWLSHTVVDLGIMAIGYHMTWRLH